MPLFIVTALVGPIEEELNRYATTLTKNQERKRIRTSLLRTDQLLSEFPMICEVSRNVLSGAVTILAGEDIRDLLKERQFAFIMLAEGQKRFASEYRLYSIRGADSLTQTRIIEILTKEFGEIVQEGVDRFFIPTPRDTEAEKLLSLPGWLSTMRQIEETLYTHDIQAVIGIWGTPPSLSAKTAL